MMVAMLFSKSSSLLTALLLMNVLHSALSQRQQLPDGQTLFNGNPNPLGYGNNNGIYGGLQETLGKLINDNNGGERNQQFNPMDRMGMQDWNNMRQQYPMMDQMPNYFDSYNQQQSGWQDQHPFHHHPPPPPPPHHGWHMGPPPPPPHFGRGRFGPPGEPRRPGEFTNQG